MWVCFCIAKTNSVCCSAMCANHSILKIFPRSFFWWVSELLIPSGSCFMDCWRQTLLSFQKQPQTKSALPNAWHQNPAAPLSLHINWWLQRTSWKCMDLKKWQGQHSLQIAAVWLVSLAVFYNHDIHSYHTMHTVTSKKKVPCQQGSHLPLSFISKNDITNCQRQCIDFDNPNSNRHCKVDKL